MPGGNRTGPMGAGPMSGRGMGTCAGNPDPDDKPYGQGLGLRRGFGRGFGFGRGRGWNRIKMLENELALITKRQEEIK